jgi:hypothetical protein
MVLYCVYVLYDVYIYTLFVHTVVPVQEWGNAFSMEFEISRTATDRGWTDQKMDGSTVQ